MSGNVKAADWRTLAYEKEGLKSRPGNEEIRGENKTTQDKSRVYQL